MVPEIIKTAEKYVEQQIEPIGTHVPRKDAQEAVRKVAKAIEEVRNASAKSMRADASR